MQRLINNHPAVYETEGVHCPLPIRTLIELKVVLALNCRRFFHVMKSISVPVQLPPGVAYKVGL
jgi:hypothetical protein